MNLSEKVGIASVVLVMGALLTCGLMASAINAANIEAEYTGRIHTKAVRWATVNSQLGVSPSSLVCHGRSFGYRWPTDPVYCSGYTLGGIPAQLACFPQGCRINRNYMPNGQY
jgi:hypothetical protein